MPISKYKFRGIDIFFGDFVSGNYYAEEPPYYPFVPKGCLGEKTRHWIFNWSSMPWAFPGVHQTEVFPETISQYVSRLDWWNNELYGGDIVDGKWPYATKCVVVWSVSRCGFYLKPISAWGKASYDSYYKLNSTKKIEKVGTIYKNFELLDY